jgi:cytochrome d ubiquinol oxidase subunit II
VHWEATHVTLSACPGSCWDLGLFVTGAVPALFFGVAVGNVLQGVPFRFDDTLRMTYELVALNCN